MIFYRCNQPVQSCPYQRLPSCMARVSLPSVLCKAQHKTSTPSSILHLLCTCVCSHLGPDLAKCYALPLLMIYSVSV